LLVTELKVALVAHKVLSLVVLGKPALILSALVADSACASLAVMAALLREGAELLGKGLVARETLFSILDLVFA
jgi:hypothetical protein